MSGKKGCELTYEWVAGLLRDCCFPDSARRMGLEMSGENALVVRFLGRNYRVTKEGVALIDQTISWDAGGADAECNIKSVLGYYVLSKAPGTPVGDYCSLETFSGGIFRESDDRMSMKLFADTYGDGPEKLKYVLEGFGAEYEHQSRAGKYLWRYNLLPKLPVQWIFYEGDDEFPSKLQTLYDRSAISVFNFEQLAVLHSIVYKALLSL